MNLRSELERRFSEALARAGAPEGSPALVAPAARSEFGDYQVNGAMPAAKRTGEKPRELAEKLIAEARVDDLAASLEVAGPGFVNIRLRDDFLAGRAAEALDDDRLGVEPPERPLTVVVDYSHPNVAKEMHVGHLRSTIIGDAICRTLAFLGHNVIRQNHIGDWGTQFGMLTAFLEREEKSAVDELNAMGQHVANVQSTYLPDLESFYRRAKALFDTDPEFAKTARDYVVKLQAGDEKVREMWRRFRELSLHHCQKVYDRLNVTLTPDDVRGESAYNDDLPKVIEALDAKGLLRESEGAKCVFLDEFTNSDGEVLPVIVQKADGGYLYATTDLAAIRYRAGELHADRILYVVDARQSLHLRQVFAVARAAGFAPPEVSLEHHPFGMMLDEGGTVFKTREGGTVRLMDLLDEAERRAFKLVSDKSPDLPEAQRRDIARAVGIGAVKYADLSQNRTSDYVFSWDKMLSLEGNTAPYMQYAYARICSIFRKGAEAEHPPSTSRDLSSEALPKAKRKRAGISLSHSAERTLALKLAQFPETVDAVARECLPNLLCNYLYDLAGAFMGFYENCPVLKSDEPLRTSRLSLCELTARTIRQGLGLLGIETIERM